MVTVENSEPFNKPGIYNQTLVKELTLNVSIESSHLTALMTAGLTESGLLKARGLCGLPLTMKPGTWSNF